LHVVDVIGSPHLGSRQNPARKRSGNEYWQPLPGERPSARPEARRHFGVHRTIDPNNTHVFFNGLAPVLLT
jgi:hypothetical protein